MVKSFTGALLVEALRFSNGVREILNCCFATAFRYCWVQKFSKALFESWARSISLESIQIEQLLGHQRIGHQNNWMHFLVNPLCVVSINLQTRAGSHDNIPRREIDAGAFSYSKAFPKPDPSKFVKAREGNGGTMIPKPKPVLSTAEIAQNRVKNKQSKLLTHPAFCPRPNPPNTELRRFYERGDLPIQIDHGGVANRLAWKVEIQTLGNHWPA